MTGATIVEEVTVSRSNDGPIRTLPAPACRFCGREGTLLHDRVRDLLFGAPGEWGVRRCGPCDLAWLDPVSETHEIGKLYQRYHTHAAEDEGGSGPWWNVFLPLFRAMRSVALGYPHAEPLWTGAAAAALACFTPLRDLGAATALWLPARREGGRVLDVGCGSGALLGELTRLGWQAEGIETDAPAVAAAARRVPCRIQCSPLKEGLFEPESFDAVTLNHVVEHFADPVEALRICRGYLKPGGTLVALTPNLHALCRSLFGRSWRGWESPRHMVLFSPRSLRECARRAGLTPRVSRTTARGAPLFWTASLALRRRADAVLAGRTGGSAVSKLAAMVFGVLEHALNPVGSCGEETLLIATRRS